MKLIVRLVLAAALAVALVASFARIHRTDPVPESIPPGSTIPCPPCAG